MELNTNYRNNNYYKPITLEKMKKLNNKIVAMTIAATTLGFAACSDDSKDNSKQLAGGSTLSGDITEDVTLAAGNTYKLSGEYIVKAGATLNIEQGVTILAIDDDIVDYILIEQGAKINAQGTATNPVVMTSERKESGAWGGLHICGYAPTNVSGGTGSSEIGDATYGGTNKNDNSGVLKYVRLEYTGFALDEEHEANGISFYGVGNGTTVDYVQSYKGGDDGFEFFGGTVDIKHAVSTSNSDDSFDWTEGWSGRAQFLVAYQEEKSTLGYDCDCLLECDNNGTDFTAKPVAHPIIANATLIGNGESGRGVRLRAGTEVELYNTIVCGKGKPLSVETTETETALSNGTSKIDYVSISSELTSKEGIYTNKEFIANEHNTANAKDTFTKLYIGTKAGAATVNDSFFEKVTFSGAVSADNDWTAGWTK